MRRVLPPVVALHTAARRYCIERAQKWQLRDGQDRKRVDITLAPRHLVLNALLWEVERLAPGEVDGLEELHELLTLASSMAESPFTTHQLNQVAAQAMEEERHAFRVFVAGWSKQALEAVEPLPYRHVLSLTESRRLWAGLREHWGIKDSLWHPLLATEMPPDVMAFQAEPFARIVPPETLRQILSQQGVARVWELREGGSALDEPEYELDLALLEVGYDGREGYWTVSGMDWLLYASHEGSITVAGERLLQSVQATWPQWRDGVFTELRWW